MIFTVLVRTLSVIHWELELQVRTYYKLYIINGMLKKNLKKKIGKVKLAFHKNTGEQVAIKIINKELIAQKPAMEPKLRREIAVMKLLNHPYVLHMYDVIDTPEFLYFIYFFLHFFFAKKF